MLRSKKTVQKYYLMGRGKSNETCGCVDTDNNGYFGIGSNNK